MFSVDGVLLFFLLLLWLVLIQETSTSGISSDRQDSTDISVLSSLHANASSSWFSPSGRFSFGFYPEGDGFFVGIRLLVSSSETRVVWTARPDMKPYPSEAVFNFTPQGFFITLNKESTSPIPLFKFISLASSAAMLDNGNFVVYSTNSSNIQGNSPITLEGGTSVTTVTTSITTPSGTTTVYKTYTSSYLNCKPYNRNCQGSFRKDSPKIYRSSNSTGIIWRSFDYPTDTILGSQILPCNHNLTSSAGLKRHSIGVNVLSMQCNGDLVIHSSSSAEEIWNSKTSGEDYTRLVLDEDGRLYLSSLTGNQKDISGYKPQNVTETMVYAATLDSDNYFRLYAVNLKENSTLMVNEIPYYKDQCQEMDICGVNSYCTIVNSNPECSCMPGFEYINPSARAAGCQRSHLLPRCGMIGTGNLSITTLKNIAGLDELAYSVTSADTAEDCSSKCADDCDCYAAVFREQRCSKLRLPFSRVRKDPNDPSVAFIKLTVEAGKNHAGIAKRKRQVRIVAIVVCSIVASLIGMGVIAACGGAYWRLFVKFREQWDKWELALAEEIAPRYFSYDEIPKDYESKNQLGGGTHGTVFKATMPISGHFIDVAVKRLHSGTGEEAEKDFRAEMSLIGRARHTNLVRLLGFCYDGFVRVLVYEYMSRGTLADHIFNKSKRLDWARRLRLLLGAARGIHYLHCECESKIIHRDIKPENILVSDDWTAKISDFGLVKHMSAKQKIAATLTVAAGTDGYIAPECGKVDEITGEVMLTEKVDVYSYGIVVLETICSEKNNKEGDLQKKVREGLEKGEVWRLWEGEQVDDAWEIERVVNMGMLCVQEDPNSRPTMEEVVMMLEEVMK